MQIQLSDHFTYKKLLRFTLPSVIMMVFTSIYSVIDDGLFVSNFVGKTAFVAINLMGPILTIIGAIGYMIGAGGSALIAKTLGEDNREEANQYFSLLIYFSAVIGIILTLIGYLVLRPFSIAVGAEGEVLEYCLTYGKIILPFVAPFLLQNVFQSFLITAEKPKIAMAITIISGISNITLDILLIIVLDLGLTGAVWATASGIVFGSLLPLIYFIGFNKSSLKFTKPKINWKAIAKTCTNGVSQFMTNMSMGIVTILYNFQLMQIAGEDGVAAYSVIMYITFIFAAVFLGYSQSVIPIIGYQYGAKNDKELKNLFRKSLTIVVAFGVALTILAEASALPLAKIFVSYDINLLEMTIGGFRIYSLSFLFMGLNLFGSAFFMALSNGFVSGVLSILRALVFQIGMVFILPMILGLNGVWWAIVLAELIALAVTIGCFIKMNSQYHYM